MGRDRRIEVYTRTEPDAVRFIETVAARLEAAGRDLDPTDPEGELGRINRHAVDDYLAFTDLDLYRCVDLALDYAKASEGAFDPSLGSLLRLHRRRIVAARQRIGLLRDRSRQQ